MFEPIDLDTQRYIERNMIQLDQKWINHMISLPESGMGYQIVKITLKNGKTMRRFIMNCEHIQKVDDTDTFTSNDIESIEMAE